MLVTDRAARTHHHAHFFDLSSFLRRGDLLVVNDSATLPAAIPATRADGEALTLHVATKIDTRIWLTEPRGGVHLGEELSLPEGGSVVMIAPVEPEHARVWYAWYQLPRPMDAYLARVGEPIRYRYVGKRLPLRDYQTIFARRPGSSEMPSAARPFTPAVLDALGERGIEVATLTLHCGVASFEVPERPATEWYAIPHATADKVNAVRRDGSRVVAVGTTVLRAMESAVEGTEVVAAMGWTDLVIDDRHTVRTADALLTGFHDAAATHQSILRAFADRELLAQAYDRAAEGGYYYHEFGDMHLIL
jgi:S-adenosylmethionine:tRNA ribosyltransferase-isomerase